jgi:ribosomal protein S10
MLVNFNLTVRSINNFVLKAYCIFLFNVFQKLKLKFSSIKLPKKTKTITVLKSPHVYKKAFEHFNLITFSSFFVFKSVPYNLFKFMLLNKPKMLKLKLNKYETVNS